MQVRVEATSLVLYHLVVCMRVGIVRACQWHCAVAHALDVSGTHAGHQHGATPISLVSSGLVAHRSSAGAGRLL